MNTTSAIGRGGLGMFAAPLALIVTGALLALNLNVAKSAMIGGASPAAYLFLSILGATAGLWVMVAASGQLPRLVRPNLAYGFWSGLLSVAAPNTILFLAIPHVGAGFVAITGAFPPLYTYFLALLLGMESPRWLRAAGVAAGIAGALILGVSKAGLDPEGGFWIAVTLCVPVIVGIGNIYRTRYWPKGTTSLQLAPLMLTGSAIWIGVFVLAFEPGRIVPAFIAGMNHALLPLQILTVAFMYVMYFVLQRIAGPVYFSQIGSVGAVLGAGMAVAWFAEPLPPAVLPAALCIAIGVACVTLGQRRG